jgi:hypothetical protein
MRRFTRFKFRVPKGSGLRTQSNSSRNLLRRNPHQIRHDIVFSALSVSILKNATTSASAVNMGLMLGGMGEDDDGT